MSAPTLRGVAPLFLLLHVSCLCSGSRFTFYRSLRNESSARDGELAGEGTRRVFGGAAASLDRFPAACALLDRSLEPRCSCAVVCDRWAVTAAHCVTPRVAYVKYNARRPAPADDGDLAPVHLLYTHPQYRVEQADEGRGMDVVLLHHDIGLVRTRRDMLLRIRPSPPPVSRASPNVLNDPLSLMTLYDPDELVDQEIQVFGFGRTETRSLGEELCAVRLRVGTCVRGAQSWRHCGCARGAGGGVCAGDSGGPVVYRGVQIGVTSMGPLECLSSAEPPDAAGSMSVFTALRPYAPLLDATMRGAEGAVGMRVVQGAPPPPRSCSAAAAAAAAAALVLHAAFQRHY